MASIIASELEIYKGTVDDSVAANNGGLMTTTKVTSGGVQNVFPHVFKAERVAGSSMYRKIFLKVSNDSDNTLYNPQIWLDRPTSGDDYVVMFAGTQDDTEATTAEAKYYGASTLNTAITGGVTTTIIVNVEDGCHMAGATPIFAANDVVHISDKVDPDSVAGNEELVTINGSAPTDGVQDPVTLEYPVTFVVTAAPTNSYTTTDTRICTVYEPDDVVAKMEVGSWVETSAGSGTFDETTYPLVLDNIGTIYDDWTIEFTAATTFTVTGVNSGQIATGDTSTDINEDNTDWGTGKKYFFLDATGWAGTWALGDTVEFTTIPAAVPMWEKRIVPAGADSVANNRVVHVSTGEAI